MGCRVVVWDTIVEQKRWMDLLWGLIGKSPCLTWLILLALVVDLGQLVGCCLGCIRSEWDKMPVFERTIAELKFSRD